MNKNQHANEILKIICLVVVLAGLLFAITAWAQTTDPMGSTEADVTPGQDAPDANATDSQQKSLWQQRYERRRARAQVFREKIAARQAALNSQTVSTAAPGPAALVRINVAYKLDPRLSGPTYGGERWVSPPTYTQVQDGSNTLTVPIRVGGLDAKGQSVAVNPKWIPADPKIVTVSPEQGNAVTLAVHGAGESTVQLKSQGVSRTLTVKATSKNNILQVEISQ